jgi:hypothetical protein
MACIRFVGAGAHFSPHHPALTGADSLLLTFLDFNQLICDEAMRFAVHCDGCFFARGFDKAKNFACAFIEPVFQLLHTILFLSLEVSCVSALNSLSRQPIHMIMDIQKKLLHSRCLLFC